MGLFDLFKSKPKGASAPPPPVGDKNVARLGRVVSDRMAQTYDRIEAIEALGQMRSKDAVAALLRRFTLHVEPNITDQEEKDAAYQRILDLGEFALEPVRDFCAKADSLSWPLKILAEILEEESYRDEVVGLLDDHETEYTRNVDPKVQLISALEGPGNDEIREVVSRFLTDVSEPVRFAAVSTMLSANDATAVDPLVELAVDEESVRIRNRIAEGFAQRGWTVPAEKREAFASAIYTGGFRLDRDGHVAS